MCRSVSAWLSCTVTRMGSRAFPTLPSRTYSTPNSRATSCTFTALPLCTKVELREMTSRSWKRDSSVMISSVRPSAKNSCSGSPLMLTSGSTAIDGFLGPVAAIAEDVVVLDDHVAEIDADAKLYPPRRRDVRVASRHPALDLRGAQHRVGDAVELDQHAVAGGLDDAAAVLRDSRIDQLDPMGLETRECPRLVDLHEPTVADHVGGEDRSEPALWSRDVHFFGSLIGSLADEGL